MIFKRKIIFISVVSTIFGMKTAVKTSTPFKQNLLGKDFIKIS